MVQPVVPDWPGTADLRGMDDIYRCGITWGVCPRHGETLLRCGRRLVCTTCPAGWPVEALEPCRHHAEYLTDSDGLLLPLPMCGFHLKAARRRWPNLTVRLVDSDDLATTEPPQFSGRYADKVSDR